MCHFEAHGEISAGSMYRLHNTSDHSGVTNMYSLSNAGGNGSSRANTPVLQNRSNHQQYLFDTGGVGGGDQGSFISGMESRSF